MIPPERQAAADVLMIRPAAFASNQQTAASNRFQVSSSDVTPAQVQGAALAEFSALVAALSKAGVAVHVFDDIPSPQRPDAIFPNNWVSFHADGSAVLYPMLAENRRAERRHDVLEALSVQQGFRIVRVVDLTHHERDGKFLEGTGSLVLDRTHRIAYACLSPRTDLDVLGDFAQQLDYDVVAFEACDPAGVPIYHTNVLMSVGTHFAAVCSCAIREDERQAVLTALQQSGRSIVELSFQQMAEFAGNMLELCNRDGQPLVVLSSRARASLLPEQAACIEERARMLVTADIPTIERVGGGSARCMIAEIHLPRRG